ncbi:putative GDP-mannose-dependent alpha-(1-2)-phosphatidylinositol mannosyltransferase [Schaalia georgiae F0490]|uniref:Putative GDP-mannose-dependent alpha-(1-2)-phosphatidylinositol mannosyltransferase n=1 Tax=Schaalia georgiae F0490 TaxID=1125717 RepID=J0N3Z7_9ACTO|nr:glycosyltransferase family 4 protein [Schaalia georgiae]EJF39117.1 putative GDP-mannose-dependent alpha-(1-2)-phosphatidylinositol mannosyltransferase [Schaalia georgiae F0490]
MRIGIVNPYSWDVPGGVGFHIRDLALKLRSRGHDVRVLSPSSSSGLPEWVTSAGSSVSVPFNGSVANISINPAAFARTRRWLADGDFDVVHVHEPVVPSVSMAATILSGAPLVATFHAALTRSLSRSIASAPMRPYMERIAVRIAVSSEARRTLIEHHGGDAVIIPNGVDTASFRGAEPIESWRARDGAPVVVFLGRLDEPRKGLPVFAGAIPRVLEAIPGARFLIAGRGEAEAIRSGLARFGDSVQFLGGISDPEKESLLAGASAYVAPQTGGESFGIVLVEAMAAGTAVVASSIEAFRAVLGDGRFGALFETGSAESLADELIALLGDPQRLETIARAGEAASLQYDWEVVADKVYEVYKLAIDTGSPAASGSRSARNLIRGRGEEGR